jgi:L-arabinose isomerase
MGDWAAAMGIEAVYIDKDTTIRNFKKDLMLGEIFFK